MTDAGGLTPLVTNEAMIVGRRIGRYVACCGAEILAANLTMPEAGRCRPGRGVTASNRRHHGPVRSERITTQAQPVSTTPSAPGVGPDPGQHSDLAVLVLQVSWALADAAHDLPAGRMPARRRAELADTLSALG